MKTVMKELLDIYKEGDSEYYWHMQDNAESFLEKEKEQIINFHVNLIRKGLEQEGNEIEWDYDELRKEAEDYYSQTYNQNK